VWINKISGMEYLLEAALESRYREAFSCSVVGLDLLPDGQPELCDWFAGVFSLSRALGFAGKVHLGQHFQSLQTIGGISHSTPVHIP
jgi:hypothetical protein